MFKESQKQYQDKWVNVTVTKKPAYFAYTGFLGLLIEPQFNRVLDWWWYYLNVSKSSFVVCVVFMIFDKAFMVDWFFDW